MYRQCFAHGTTLDTNWLNESEVLRLLSTFPNVTENTTTPLPPPPWNLAPWTNWLFRCNYLAFQIGLGGVWVDMADWLNLCSNLAVFSWTGETRNWKQHFSHSFPSDTLSTMQASPVGYTVRVGRQQGHEAVHLPCLCQRLRVESVSIKRPVQDTQGAGESQQAQWHSDSCATGHFRTATRQSLPWRLWGLFQKVLFFSYPDNSVSHQDVLINLCLR